MFATFDSQMVKGSKTMDEPDPGNSLVQGLLVADHEGLDDHGNSCSGAVAAFTMEMICPVVG